MGVMVRPNTGCFLIGSGPSLRAVDVSRLSGVPSICFNRSYVAWKAWGFAPQFYACLDDVVVEDNAVELRALIGEFPQTRFFLHDSARSYGISAMENVVLIKTRRGSSFGSNLEDLTDFGNVGATSLQILMLLGYRRVAMVGVDARYSPVESSMVVDEKDGYVLVADDPDHFCPEYVQGKRLIASPDVKKVLGQWPAVAQECMRHSVDVRNASPGTALTCFPLIDFVTAIDWVIN